MGKSQRNKGYRGEYNLVKMLKEQGVEAKRVPLSGATDFQKGDAIINEMKAEIKSRKSGFKRIYDWLENVDLLFIKADRKPYLVVMPLEKFIKLVKKG
jgi:Holliday junction resolvase